MCNKSQSTASGGCRIELDQVSHGFAVNEQVIQLFSELSLTVQQGQSYAIVGPSGAGKSSLLMLLAGLEQPSAGTAAVVDSHGRQPLAGVRENMGFVFQQFHLLPELSALHNVALPLKLRGIKQAQQQATAWLERVGLGHRLNHRPQQLSGGEQQRVAIARALVFEPKFIFADEPTGNLDTSSANEVADILFSCCRENGAGLVLVTHSDDLAARAENLFALHHGRCQVQPCGRQHRPVAASASAEVAIC